MFAQLEYVSNRSFEEPWDSERSSLYPYYAQWQVIRTIFTNIIELVIDLQIFQD
jgi:hypothetical protein